MSKQEYRQPARERMNSELYHLAHTAGLKLKQKGQMLATAESCTGGLIAEAITRIPGSSHWFERGFVTYSLESKMELLGVSKGLLSREGAVSEPVAKKMAGGALSKSHAHFALATTGIAGPSGSTKETPLGVVWIAWANSHTVWAQKFQFRGNRIQIREEAAKTALSLLISKL